MAHAIFGKYLYQRVLSMHYLGDMLTPSQFNSKYRASAGLLYPIIQSQIRITGRVVAGISAWNTSRNSSASLCRRLSHSVSLHETRGFTRSLNSLSFLILLGSPVSLLRLPPSWAASRYLTYGNVWKLLNTCEPYSGASQPCLNVSNTWGSFKDFYWLIWEWGQGVKARENPTWGSFKSPDALVPA